jgi:hypothetical protein
MRVRTEVYFRNSGPSKLTWRATRAWQPRESRSCPRITQTGMQTRMRPLDRQTGLRTNPATGRFFGFRRGTRPEANKASPRWETSRKKRQPANCDNGATHSLA